MGQQGSSQEPPTVDLVHGKLKQQTEILKRIAKLSYKEFRDSVSELNQITSSFSDRNGKQLDFCIKAGSDDSIIWKGTVRITCRKIHTRTGKICSIRDLGLRQYIMVYKEITEHVADLPPATPGGVEAPFSLTASIILDGAENKSLELEEECCICMMNEAKTIMPCTHKFCENCCREWTDAHNTCPICRAKCTSSADTWELTDAPDSSEFKSEVCEVLVGIADRKSRREQT